MLAMDKKQTIDDLAKDFGEKASSDTLQALKAIKGLKPEMAPDGKKATFKLKEPIGGQNSFSFQKIDKFWYIANE